MRDHAAAADYYFYPRRNALFDFAVVVGAPCERQVYTSSDDDYGNSNEYMRGYNFRVGDDVGPTKNEK